MQLVWVSLPLKSWVKSMSKFAHTYKDFTFDELVMLATIYYKALVQKGVFPGKAVALCVERFGVGPNA